MDSPPAEPAASGLKLVPATPAELSTDHQPFTPAAGVASGLSTFWAVGLLVVILAFGTFMRVHRLGTLPESFDAALYKHYLDKTFVGGLSGYPDLVDHYIEQQQQMPGAILPPTRFLYIFCGYAWHGVTGQDAITSLRNVACTSSILLLIVSAVFVWRVAGPLFSVGVTALMSTAPVQIHMSEHALIDGFFSFWAMLVLWALWECLRAPDHPGWQAFYALAGALLVLTKENAFFVYFGVAGLLLLNTKLHFGTTTLRLLLLTVAGPLLGLVILLFLAGGAETFLHVYRLLVAKNYTLQYAIMTGDGPWHRYLVDLLLVSPWTLLLAVGAVFCLRWTNKPALFFSGFVGVTYLLMCNVKYAMNLRYSTIWDLPLRYLAFAQLVACAQRLASPRHARWAVLGGVVLLCAYDLHQWQVLFVKQHLLELVSEYLLRAQNILKGPLE